jgi:hypothetical protein
MAKNIVKGTDQLPTLRIVVASPVDTWAECDLLEQLVTELNLRFGEHEKRRMEIVRWNMSKDYYWTHYSADDWLDDLTNSFLRFDEADLFVGLFWKQFGPKRLSAAYHEIFDLAYRTHLARRHPRIWLFFNQKEYALDSEWDLEELREVQALKGRFESALLLRQSERTMNERYCWTYRGTAEFTSLISEQLNEFVQKEEFNIDDLQSRQESIRVKQLETARQDADITSAYIVHSSVIALGNYPFEPVPGLRPVWARIFNSKRCFSSFPTLLWDDSCWQSQRIRRMILTRDGRDLWPGILQMDRLNSKPFIRGLGAISFDTRRVHFELGSERRSRLLYNLREVKDPWPPLQLDDADDDRPDIYYDDKRPYFGFDSGLSDQRMNYLNYELRKPLFIRATEKLNGCKPKGKVFVHIYPCGYIVVHVALSLSWPDGKVLTRINDAVVGTIPGNKQSHLKWSSRLGDGTLFEITETVLKRLQQSIYVDKSKRWHSISWTSCVKINSTDENEELAGAFFLEGDDYKYLNPHDQFIKSRCHVHTILVSKKRLACVFEPGSGRRDVLRVFWNIMDLHEFVALKGRIYRDYAQHLSQQILELSVFRRSLRRKLTKEDLLRFTVYDENIPIFLANLDRRALSLSPFYRYVYSLISAGTGFDEVREKVKTRVTEWGEEVDKWEHPLAVIWKRILSPLKSLLSS